VAGTEAADPVVAALDDNAPGGPAELNVWALRVVPPLVYLLCAVVLGWPVLTHLGRQVPGGADGLLMCWYFEWTEYSLAHLHNPFVTDWLNAPHGINTMWNTGNFGLTLIFAPVTAAFGPIAAGGIAMVLSPVASASACYVALRRITGTGWRSAVVALLYGFGPFFQAQAGHLQLTWAVYPPLILLLGHRLLVRQPGSPIRTGGWLGLLVGLQLLTGEEVLVLATVVTVLAVAALLIVFGDRLAGRLRYAVTGTVTGAAVAFVIAGVPLGIQFLGPHALHGGVGASDQRLGLAGTVVPGRFQHFSTAWDRQYFQTRLPANGIENTGYLGWLLIALIIGTCIWLGAVRDRFVWWWLITAVLTVALSLGTPAELDSRHQLTGHSPWAAVQKLPLLKGVVPVRFTLITALLVVLLLGWGLARLRPGLPAAIGVVAVLLCYVTLWPAGHYTKFQKVQTPAFFTSSAVQRLPAGTNALLLPVTTDPEDGARVMVWQLRAEMRFKIAGGWSVFSNGGRMTYQPQLPGYLGLLNGVGGTGQPPSPAALAAARSSVAGSGIDYIVITQQQPNESAVASAAAAITGCRLEQVADVTVCQVQHP
jgi:hypothetical protein